MKALLLVALFALVASSLATVYFQDDFSKDGLTPDPSSRSLTHFRMGVPLGRFQLEAG